MINMDKIFGIKHNWWFRFVYLRKGSSPDWTLIIDSRNLEWSVELYQNILGRAWLWVRDDSSYGETWTQVD